MSTIRAGRTKSTSLSIESDGADSIVFMSSNNRIVTIDNTGVTVNANSLVLPTGNTATRPANPITGEIRYNTTTSSFEVYTGTIWDGLTTRTTSVAGTFIPADYLIVAGGGGGGGWLGGGGAGGGVLYASDNSLFSPNVLYTITIGAGAVGKNSAGGAPSDGSNTSISGLGIADGSLTAIGGGGGGTYAPPFNPTGAGGRGGSGGGGSAGGSGTPAASAAGGEFWRSAYGPLVNFRQGYMGGFGQRSDGSRSSGAGGGAGQAGANATSTTSFNNGGNGYSWLNGVFYGGGGGGTGILPTGSGPGGLGGGGAAAANIGVSGTVNTGGGGGGCINEGGPAGFPLGNTGGAGGSGVVIIRYLNSFAYISNTTGNVLTTNVDGFIYQTFYGSGTIIWS